MISDQTEKDSVTVFGSDYECVLGESCALYLAGSITFTVDDYEVDSVNTQSSQNSGQSKICEFKTLKILFLSTLILAWKINTPFVLHSERSKKNTNNVLQ